MYQKDADGMANNVDPYQSLSWVHTICPGLSVRKLRIIAVYILVKNIFAFFPHYDVFFGQTGQG